MFYFHDVRKNWHFLKPIKILRSAGVKMPILLPNFSAKIFLNFGHFD
jgi:hypothetical protein